MYNDPLPKSVFDFLSVTPVGFLSFCHILQSHKFHPEDENEKPKFRTWLVLDKKTCVNHPFFTHVGKALHHYGKQIIGEHYEPGPQFPLHGLRTGEQEASFTPPDDRKANEFYLIKVHSNLENKPKIIYSEDELTETDIFPGRDAQLLVGLYSWKKGKTHGPGINIGLKAVKILSTGKPILTGAISQEKAVDVFEQAQTAITGQTVGEQALLDQKPKEGETDEPGKENIETDIITDKDVEIFDANKLISGSEVGDDDPPF